MFVDQLISAGERMTGAEAHTTAQFGVSSLVALVVHNTETGGTGGIIQMLYCSPQTVASVRQPIGCVMYLFLIYFVRALRLKRMHVIMSY